MYERDRQTSRKTIKR